MTSPIGGNVSREFDAKNVTATSMYTNKTSTEAGASKSVADQDTFLKLLVAQLKYQDPSNPADSTQFLAVFAPVSADAALDSQIVLDALHRASGWLRAEIAAAITRKRAPRLVFRYLPGPISPEVQP